jgi:excisionase family DNA binding protein
MSTKPKPRRNLATKDAMISSGAAAELLGVDQRTIRRMVRDERLPAHRTAGGRYLFRRADVEAHLARRDNREGATTTSAGPSNLQAMRDDTALINATADNLQAKKRLAGIEADEQAKQDAEAAQHAEETARAERARQERAEQRQRDEYRAAAERLSEDYIPEDAPLTLSVRYHQTVKRVLDECGFLDGIPRAAMDQIEAAAKEIFAPWELQRQTEERATWLAQVNRDAITAAVQVVRSHLQERHRQGFLKRSLDSQDVELLVHIAEEKVRKYLEAEACKRELTEDEAKQLARDFIDTDYQLI